jgi:hypothetical protein
MLLDTDEGKAAITDFETLAQVVKHKATFFRSGWAGYDTAQPGTLQLLPNDARMKDLRADYRAIAPMMFDEIPVPFDEILTKIAAVQEKNKHIVRSRLVGDPHQISCSGRKPVCRL